MKKLHYIYLLLLLAIFSCKDKDVNDAFITLEDLPAANYMKSNPEDFSMWVDLLEYTGLFNALNLSGTYTCFVPTNQAVTEYLASINKSSVRDLDLEYAKILVKYHIIISNTQKYTQSYFKNGTINDSTASGDYLTIEIREGGINSIYVNSVSRIVKPDIDVTNAVIHTIEKVLIPVTESVWSKLSANSDYSVFQSAIKATGYDTLLNNIKYRNTVFVVPDNIFSALEITDIPSLSIYLGAGSDYLNIDNVLNKFVAYHILQQQMSYTELSSFATDNLSKNINTLAKNEIINISDFEGSLYINRDTITNTEVKLLAINNNCKNGIIHEIDNLMPVASPKPAPVIWEFTAYPELAVKYPSVYQVQSLSSSSTNTLSEGSVSCYTWKTVLPDNMSSSVKYYVHRSGEDRAKALNSDYLRLRLLLYGWIEMTTPGIVKGTYNLKLSYYAVQNGAYKFSLIVDGNLLGVITLETNPNRDEYMKDKSIAANLTFDTTREHTIRLLSNDNSELELDYILFEPVQ